MVVCDVLVGTAFVVLYRLVPVRVVLTALVVLNKLVPVCVAVAVIVVLYRSVPVRVVAVGPVDIEGIMRVSQFLPVKSSGQMQTKDSL